MWFDSWSDIGRILLVGTAAYATLVIILRTSGKRTLSQLNAFDFVVTVAIGSTLATILLNPDLSWSEGLAALCLLVGLQFVVAFVSSRWPPARSLVSSQPVVLVRDGSLQRDAIARNRLTETEVEQAVRSSGTGDLSTIAAVVLETNGTLSVISRAQYGDGSAMGSMHERDTADET